VGHTVLIVDDHTGFRSFARRLLEAGGFDVIGEAGDAIEAAEAVRRLRPQLVLLDLQLPGEDGLVLATRLAATPVPPIVVLVSSRDPGDYGPRLRSSGAAGFIPKAELSPAAVAALLRAR
jgi:DNA-binding NarL/FixJ family response regulator